MTKELLPELGSGALREALQKWQRKYFSAGISHEMWPNAVEHAFEAGWQAALSLSSPIEPQCHELTDADAVECKNCGLGIGYWPSQPECARPTPQASSEIREALEKLLFALVADLRERETRNKNSGHPSMQGFSEAAGYAAAKIEQIIGSERWREALAPSRQGAAKSNNLGDEG